MACAAGGGGRGRCNVFGSGVCRGRYARLGIRGHEVGTRGLGGPFGTGTGLRLWPLDLPLWVRGVFVLQEIELLQQVHRPVLLMPTLAVQLACGAMGARQVLEGQGPPRPPQHRLGRRLEEVAKAVGGGYCRL